MRRVAAGLTCILLVGSTATVVTAWASARAFSMTECTITHSASYSPDAQQTCATSVYRAPASVYVHSLRTPGAPTAAFGWRDDSSDAVPEVAGLHSFQGADSRIDHTRRVEAHGWPFLALWIEFRPTLHFIGRSPLFEAPLAIPFTRKRIDPRVVITGAVLIGLAPLVFIGGFALVSRIRRLPDRLRAHRSAAGLCSTCGYPLDARSTACPECGSGHASQT